MNGAFRVFRVLLPVGLLAASACGATAPAPLDGPSRRPRTASVAQVVPPVPIVPDGSAVVAIASQRFVLVFDRPEGMAALRLETRNPLGQRVPMLVTGGRRDPSGRPWVRVSLPIGTGDRSGWVRAEDVRLVAREERIVVDLSERELMHERNGEELHRFRVAVGAPAFETPTGTFYVWARVPQASPGGPYGAFALGLSVFSEEFPDRRVAIHGTADRGDLGLAVSHGCVRVFNPDMLALRSVPLGTPVVVRP